MKKLQLQYISTEKQLMLLVPMAVVVLVLIAIAGVNRFRAMGEVKADDGSQQMRVVQLDQPISVMLITKEDAIQYRSLLHISKTGEMTIEKADADTDAEYHATISFQNVYKLAEGYTDSVEVMLPSRLQYTDSSGMMVVFKSGNCRLLVSQIPDFLRAASLQQNREELVTDLHRALLRQYIAKATDKRSFYTAFTMYSDTDIRIYDLERYLPILEQQAKDGA